MVRVVRQKVYVKITKNVAGWGNKGMVLAAMTDNVKEL
jgi:hypothetical protein